MGQAGSGVVVSLLVGVQVGELFVGRPPLHVICRATNPLSRTFKVFSQFKCFGHSTVSDLARNENWDAK